MNNQKIAVTTASGRLGSAIINQLKDAMPWQNIVGIARTPEKAKHLGIEIRKGDYNSKGEFLKALKGIDTLLLISGSDDPDTRAQQHRNVIEAAKESGVKNLVFTSLISAAGNINELSPVAASIRSTEEDVKQSGLQWTIGRNGLYIEPDLSNINSYLKNGGISNSAAEGVCGYTSRPELAYAYVKLLTDDNLKGGTYNLMGDPVTQLQLVNAINKAYDANLTYSSISPEQYTKQLKVDLGDRVGAVVGRIYEGIRNGVYNYQSDFEKVVGRQHKSIDEMIADSIKKN